ncbi:PEP-CTERM/exosortase system-associated acyltransferase [Thauera sp. JM12B12]|uniref:PEP-CTERM/exosortase system-associated acyltransferase n=1 Tax=Thauera sp. JM12B12 TaxID=3142262 RepID=UPI0031F378E4
MVLEKYEYSVVEPGTGAYAEYLALRHEVFCEELCRIVPDGRSAGGVAIESDDYDVHSVHVLCRLKDTGVAVGCTRLILPGPKGLNVNARYKLSGLPESPSGQVGEIGRLALASSLRRHRAEASSIGGRRRALSAAGDSVHSMLKREGPVVALGLYREIINLANRYGITHCYAAMEPALARLLNRLGFPFHEAGPLNTAVSPARQPYLIGAHAAKAGLAARNSCLYRFMFGGGDVEPQVQRTDGMWPIASEVKSYRDVGLHI